MFTVNDINSEALRNVFNIFGFVKISGMFEQERKWISKEFDLMMKNKFGKTKDMSRSYFFPQFIEYSDTMTSILDMEKITILLENILGPSPIYIGSDGNIFSKSTPWHRDYLIRNKSCKMLFYLDELDKDSGALRIIPGTHFIEDKFSNYLGDSLTWPEPPYEGGFNEKNIFGKGNNPLELGKNKIIPHLVIDTKPGDVIIFNHALIHCTNAAKKNRQRRMFGMHFFANYMNVEDLEMRTHLKEKLEDLFLSEAETFKLKRRYGPAVANANSERVKKMIELTNHYTYGENGEFDGIYAKCSDNTVNFHNQLKLMKYPGQGFTN